MLRRLKAKEQGSLKIAAQNNKLHTLFAVIASLYCNFVWRLSLTSFATTTIAPGVMTGKQQAVSDEDVN